MNNTIVVTGATGLLGANLVKGFSSRGIAVRAVTHGHRLVISGVENYCLDLGSNGIQNELDEIISGCSCVIHCAANTNVDWCESHPEAARIINVTGTAQIAAAVSRAGARLIYVSTDSVFDGKSGAYNEQDIVNPLNEYARTKLEGEAVATAICPLTIVVRTNIFGWNARNKLSLAEWMLVKLRNSQHFTGYDNVYFNPLLVNDLIDIFLDLVSVDYAGIVHVGARDSCSKYDFSIKLADLFGYDRRSINRGRYIESSSVAKRPLNPVLSINFVQQLLGYDMPSLDESLERFKNLINTGYVDRLKGMLGDN